MNLTEMMNHYGYLVLFISLLVELIAFGLPTEILMGYAGLLAYQGKLGWIPSVLMAWIGSSLGISVSYYIGLKLGYPFFEKYGHKMHMGPERMEKVTQWFSRFGNKLILVAYFIPGVRHVTGYFSGITGIPFRQFAVYAYTGAFIWVFTFITLGKVLGPQWELVHSHISKYLLIGGILLVIAGGIFYVYRYFKDRILRSLSIIMRKSPLRVRLLIVGTGVLFIGLTMVMIGMIQDYMGNEFHQFDSVSALLIHDLFPATTTTLMKSVTYFASLWWLIPISVFTLLWIVFRGKDRLLEIITFAIVITGGIVLEEGLQALFYHLTTNHHLTLQGLPSAFPGEQSMMALTFWGFAAYVVGRHSRKIMVKALLSIMVMIIVVTLSISWIFLGLQVANDILAGFVFAGVWLSLNTVIMEILRELRRNPSHQ